MASGLNPIASSFPPTSSASSSLRTSTSSAHPPTTRTRPADHAAASSRPTRRPRQHPPQLQGSWLPNLPSAGGKGRGCGHYVFGSPVPSSKIAAFDLDGTVIRPRGRKSFPRDANDWEWCVTPSGSMGVVAKLREIHRAGYTILLISNQASDNPKLAQDFQRKLPAVCRQLNIPLHAFAAFEFDQNRKSATGIWDSFVRDHNGGVDVDYGQSYYVGDAAGRPTDHADTDRKFAFNTGLPFLTPEQFFDDAAADEDWTMFGFNPLAWDHTQADPPAVLSESFGTIGGEMAFGEYDGPELVLLVGPPAIGKTTYANNLETDGFEALTHDPPKPPPELLEYLRSTLFTYYTDLASSSAIVLPPDPPKFVIDSSLPTNSSRRVFINLLRQSFSASSPRLRLSCVYWADDDAGEIGKHKAVYRASEGGGALTPLREHTAWARDYQQPTLAEGFHALHPLHFRFNGPPASLARWQRFLIDVYPGKQRKTGRVAIQGAAAA